MNIVGEFILAAMWTATGADIFTVSVIKSTNFT
jgi:hypothetical protein